MRGDLIVTVEVLHELQRIEDDAYRWVKDRQQYMVFPMDNRIQSVVRQILDTHKRLVDTHRGRHHADPFVVALASVENGTVVSGGNKF